LLKLLIGGSTGDQLHDPEIQDGGKIVFLEIFQKEKFI
jgi:hypothetical protein